MPQRQLYNILFIINIFFPNILSPSVSLSPSSNPARPGFLFYLDGIQKETVYHPNSDAEQTFFLDKIEQGKHNLTFVYHQPLQVTAHKQIYLSNLEVIFYFFFDLFCYLFCWDWLIFSQITGSSLGGASEYKDCPAGTYSEGGISTTTKLLRLEKSDYKLLTPNQNNHNHNHK